jgi:hypothetical protein
VIKYAANTITIVDRTHYHVTGARRVPDYVCQRRGIEHAEPICQQIVGGELDAAIGRLLVEVVTPVTLGVALAVQKELESRSEDSDRLRRQAVERARYESDLARRRYMRCDPDNRLVADSLEAEWNQALRAQTAAQEHYDKQRQRETGLDDQQRVSILALARDFPRLWNDPHTPDRERKRMARLLIADVTLLKEADIRAQVRFSGGATHTLHLPPPKPAWMLRQTPSTVVAEIDRLLEDHTDGEIADLLNDQGLISGEGKPFHRPMVRRIRIDYALPSRHDRLRARGLLTPHEMAERLNIARPPSRTGVAPVCSKRTSMTTGAATSSNRLVPARRSSINIKAKPQANQPPAREVTPHIPHEVQYAAHSLSLVAWVTCGTRISIDSVSTTAWAL